MHGGEWLKLGWRNPVWDLVRFYLSLRGAQAEKWTTLLRDTKEMKLGDGDAIPIAPDVIDLFFEYLKAREGAFATCSSLLRTEQEALEYCTAKTISVMKTRTKNRNPSAS